MNYCARCILPDTRPNLWFDDDGQNCNCSIKTHHLIDWQQRQRDFVSLVEKIKLKNCAYDCVIPVSGGKDSTWQVVVALEHDLKPLAITWKTPARNEIGRQNLENLISLGVDHIDFSINPIVERKFTKKAFEKFGIPLIPMHMALHAIPVNFALMMGIPLILWGENSAAEYGGDAKLKGMDVTFEWLMKYGVTNGTIWSDWIDEDLSSSDLAPYRWPTTNELDAAGLQTAFLGHFFKWDPKQSNIIASKHGFKAAAKPKTGLYDFADIDDEFLITVHHWMKWYKFGFTRLWDNLSLEIRAGRLTRDQAVEIVRESSPEKDSIDEIQKFCEYIGIKQKEFFEIAETFRNPDIWQLRDDGKYIIKDFIVEDFEW